MYKNPIFSDNIPQKTINSYSNIIFFQNSLKYFKFRKLKLARTGFRISPTTLDPSILNRSNDGNSSVLCSNILFNMFNQSPTWILSSVSKKCNKKFIASV